MKSLSVICVYVTKQGLIKCLIIKITRLILCKPADIINQIVLKEFWQTKIILSFFCGNQAEKCPSLF